MDSKPANSLSEKELVRLVGDGDPRGQRELYVRYAGMMTAVASRYLSDSDTVKDVLQDAFIRIFEKFDSFLPWRGLAAGLDVEGGSEWCPAGSTQAGKAAGGR